MSTTNEIKTNPINTNTNKENESEIPGQYERDEVDFAQYILRNHNWICILILTPISLIYDLYCFCKYIIQNNIIVLDILCMTEFYYI